VNGFAGGEFCGETMATAVARAVDRAVDRVGRSDGFEDIDLAASGPLFRATLIAEQPEGGPDGFADGELCAGLKAGVFLRKVIPGIDAAGGVMAGDAIGAGHVFFLSGDDEVAIALLDVGWAGGVGFELAVAETAASSDDVPLCRVGGRAVGSVEFVAP